MYSNAIKIKGYLMHYFTKVVCKVSTYVVRTDKIIHEIYPSDRRGFNSIAYQAVITYQVEGSDNDIAITYQEEGDDNDDIAKTYQVEGSDI